ncbi:MAG: hypothetical protein ABI480_00975 [Chitinophagaceae bacterium]
MNLSRQDLAGDHYSWSDNKEGNLFNGVPSRRLFDRFNGDQVLFIINYYGSQSNTFSIEEGKQIENRIADELPMEAKSEISVLNWLKSGVAI